MATFTASSAFDYRNIIEVNNNFGDDSLTHSGSTWTESDGFLTYRLTGATLTVPDGITGTLTALSASLGGTGYFSMTGLSYNMGNDSYRTGYTVDGKTLFRMTAETAQMLRGNDAINGSAYADRLAGFLGHDTIKGNGGNDFIEGWSGNDVLYGGTGKDTLVGGSGSDTFVFNTALNATTNLDVIKDFNVAADTIKLENAIFTHLAVGTLASASFVSSNTPTPTQTNDYILYDRDNGKLFYDADGNGAGAAVQFATIGVNTALTNADFVVI